LTKISFYIKKVETDFMKALEAFRIASTNTRKSKALDLFWTIAHTEIMKRHYAQKLFRELRKEEQAEVINLIEEFLAKVRA